MQEELRYSIEINEHRKAGTGDLRPIQVIIYYEVILFDIIPKLAVYIRIHDDVELLVEFYKMIVSYQNSACEGFSFYSGVMFLTCPDLTLEAIAYFNKEDKEWIYGSIVFGVSSVLYDKEVSHEKQRLIDENMEKLRLLVDLETPLK